MFADACSNNRSSIYAFWSYSEILGAPHHITGSGFTIAPGVLATCAHLVHVNKKFNNPLQTKFFVTRSQDLEQPLLEATFIAENPIQDLALLKITSPRSTDFLTIKSDKMPLGTQCGSIGFPSSIIVSDQNCTTFQNVERFQAAFVSSYSEPTDKSGNKNSDI